MMGHSVNEERLIGVDLHSAQVSTITENFELWYAELQKPFKVVDYSDSELSNLVHGISNRQLPVHKWFNLKEAFSAQLPLWAVQHIYDEYHESVRYVLDPFIGGGTTGVSLAEKGINVVGVEYNPFIRFVAETKSQLPYMDTIAIQNAILLIDLKKPRKKIPLPELSTLENPAYFRETDIQVILHIIQQINLLSSSEETRNFLMLGVAAAIDDVASLRKDGRALRYVWKPERPSARAAITSRWKSMLDDLTNAKYTGIFKVYPGTALRLGSKISNEFDAAIYSPPYLNNFDYSEVYKLELWLLGFLQSTEQWRELRMSTVRSHPSVRFQRKISLLERTDLSDIAIKLSEMGEYICLSDKRNRQEMRDVVLGYFDDMYIALQQQWEMLRPGGFLVYVVANSRHKWLPIATDIILATLAQHIGFEPLELAILKK